MINVRGEYYVLEYLECEFMNEGGLYGEIGWAAYDIISDVIYEENGSFEVSGMIDSSKLKEEIEFARKEGFLQADESFYIAYQLTYDDTSHDFEIYIGAFPDADVSEQTASLDWSQFDVNLVISITELLIEHEGVDFEDDEY